MTSRRRLDRAASCAARAATASHPHRAPKPAVRFRVLTGGTTKFFDAVFGQREFSNDEIEDFVLLRSAKATRSLVNPCISWGLWSTISTCASAT